MEESDTYLNLMPNLRFLFLPRRYDERVSVCDDASPQKQSTFRKAARVPVRPHFFSFPYVTPVFTVNVWLEAIVLESVAGGNQRFLLNRKSSTTHALSLLRPWSATAPPSCWDPTSKSLCTLPAGGAGGGDDDDEGHSWFPILVGRKLQC